MRNAQLRTASEQAAAIVCYRRQSSVPIVRSVVSDGAGQFKLLTDKLGLCWPCIFARVAAGRHYKKRSLTVGRHAEALEAFREAYRNYYGGLQDYRAGPTVELAAHLRVEFDKLFSIRTRYEALDDRIAKTQSKRDELLMVISESSVPLHNDASELGARVSARRRDVSLHSVSIRRTRAMNVFTTIVQTSKKLGRSALEYLRDRLSGTCEPPSLSQSIQRTARSSGASD
ncbi:hypothetical protein [Adhaeretor mobilis]|nr:hypothetical protein [Adhaeretor mobilis]